MKCQKCGRDNVSFHYSSNINGSISEIYLCSHCAEESGVSYEDLFDFGNFFPTLSNKGGMMPMVMQTPKYVMPTQFRLLPATYERSQDASYDCGKTADVKNCAVSEQKTQSRDVDEDMMKRRQLYKEMRNASECEDYEKAAVLRDQIKELEGR